MSRPGAPRPGNNPFAGSQGMPRPGGGAGAIPRPAAPRPGAPRPGAPRPGGPGTGRPGAPFQQRPGGPGRPGGAGGGFQRPGGAPRRRRRFRRSSRRWRRPWPWPRRWYRRCLRSWRRQEPRPQVEADEAGRIRDAGCSVARRRRDPSWRWQHDHPDAPRRIDRRPGRQARDPDRVLGPAGCARDGAVPPRRDGDRDRVARRRHLRHPRRRAGLQDPDRQPRGRGQGAARGLRHRPRAGARGRGRRRPRDPSAGRDRHGSRRPR